MAEIDSAKDVVPFSNRLMELLTGYGLDAGQCNAVQRFVQKKIEDMDYDSHANTERAVRSERAACAALVLRAETDAKTQKGLRQQLSAIIEQRGIG